MATRVFEPKIEAVGGLLIPASAAAGRVATSDASGNVAWSAPAKKKYKSAHSWVQRRSESTLAETFDGPVIVLAEAEEQFAARVDYKIFSGTKATFKLQKNAVDIAGFTALEAKTAAAHTEPAAVKLETGDELSLVITALEGTPLGLRVCLTIEHIA